ncbi:MAG: potassium-transporting ATPase subunit KdpC [Deltaproteobacteria bacterium]|nr:potassium-transporting ATPase subunit KdpC [Deltaproteobacteria bacterium]
MLQVKRAVIVFVSFSLLCGLVYPLGITAIAQILFPYQSRGSLLISGNQCIGSELIGQMFTSPKYFHGRPSATDPAYNAGGSAGSNLGPSSAQLLEQVKERIAEMRRENGLSPATPVPADMVLASASGLDPHISMRSAMLQVRRVAGERGLPEAEVELLLRHYVETPLLRMWGQERVNVLRLNMALDTRGNNHTIN